MTQHSHTYTHGCEYNCTRDITQHDIIELCNQLRSRLEEGFAPEPISEGGIVYKNQHYKSVRFRDHTRYTDAYNSKRLHYIDDVRPKWPYILDYENVIKDWENNDNMIFRKDSKIGTVLKSFHGAKCFTVEELKVWEECMKTIGMVRVGKYPAKKHLCSIGKLGS